LTGAEREELTRLRRENRRLPKDVEILKRTAPALAAHQNRYGGPMIVPYTAERFRPFAG
jgi:hypothetical protein